MIADKEFRAASVDARDLLLARVCLLGDLTMGMAMKTVGGRRGHGQRALVTVRGARSGVFNGNVQRGTDGDQPGQADV